MVPHEDPEPDEKRFDNDLGESAGQFHHSFECDVPREDLSKMKILVKDHY